MKLLTLFSATFWTLTNAVDDLEIDAELEAGHRRLGFERLRLITSKKDAIAATEIDGNAGSSKVPFRIKGSDGIAGTVSAHCVAEVASSLQPLTRNHPRF